VVAGMLALAACGGSSGSGTSDAGSCGGEAKTGPAAGRGAKGYRGDASLDE